MTNRRVVSFSHQSCIPAFADTFSAKVECTALVEAAVVKWWISASQRFLEIPVGFLSNIQNCCESAKDLLKYPILEVLGSSCLLSGFLAEVNEKSMKDFNHMALSEDILIFLSRFYFPL